MAGARGPVENLRLQLRLGHTIQDCPECGDVTECRTDPVERLLVPAAGGFESGRADAANRASRQNDAR